MFQTAYPQKNNWPVRKYSKRNSIITSSSSRSLLSYAQTESMWTQSWYLGKRRLQKVQYLIKKKVPIIVANRFWRKTFIS